MAASTGTGHGERSRQHGLIALFDAGPWPGTRVVPVGALPVEGRLVEGDNIHADRAQPVCPRGFTMTADGLRLLQDLRRSLLEPPRQLRPRTVTAAQPADQPETVRTVA